MPPRRFFLIACLLYPNLLVSTSLNPSTHAQHPFNALSTPETGVIPRLEEATMDVLLRDLEQHSYTSHDLTSAYLDRIDLFRDINAIITINPYARHEASAADKVRIRLGAKWREHHPLLGIPFLVKDNIAIPPSAGPTTAGSYALLNSTARGASPVVQRLLDAGAVLLGTTNLDEFAQAKGDHPWGWSARGGQMKSIYGRETSSNDEALAEGYADVCGSSGGSALAVALGFGAFALGTQTGVSIVCPSARAGIVGFKPGHGGMMPMGGVVPISKHLDVVGPIARSVEDAETIWRIIKHPKGWEEPKINSGIEQSPRSRPVRIGIPRNYFHSRLIGEDNMPNIVDSFNDFVKSLDQDPRVDIIEKELENVCVIANQSMYDANSIITSHELKIGINDYFCKWTLPSKSSTRTLAEIILYNTQHSSLELPPGPFPVFGHPPREGEHYHDQSFLIKSNAIEVVGWQNSTYEDARNHLEQIGWRDGFANYFSPAEAGVDVMLVPTESSGSLASLSGVPELTIPLGSMPATTPILANDTFPLYPYPDMPFGISLLAARGHDNHERLLQVGHLIESRLKERGRKIADSRQARMRSSIRVRLRQVGDLDRI